MVSIGDIILVEGALVKGYFREFQFLIDRGKTIVEGESEE